MIVAIDGPAGAGKSTIASEVAKRLGFQLIDTGAMYRTVALKALQAGVDLADAEKLSEIAHQLHFEFAWVDGTNRIKVNGEPLGDAIRTEEVSKASSMVSTHESVREALVALQRQMGNQSDCVLEGRDIGSVVFPNAEVKIFLTASTKERARRRAEQLKEKGETPDVSAIQTEIENRDARDTQRSASPLVKTADAHEIDSTSHSPEEIVEMVLNFAFNAQS
jgi:cytidylate kinase